MMWIAGYVTSGDPTNGGELVYHWITAVGITVAMVFWIRVARTISHAQDTLASEAVNQE
jgi:hypothetical protein